MFDVNKYGHKKTYVIMRLDHVLNIESILGWSVNTTGRIYVITKLLKAEVDNLLDNTIIRIYVVIFQFQHLEG